MPDQNPGSPAGMCGTPYLRQPGATITVDGQLVWRNSDEEWQPAPFYVPAPRKPQPGVIARVIKLLTRRG